MSKVLKFILENQSKYKIVLILKVANIVRPISIDKISLVTNKLTEGNVTRQPLQKKNKNECKYKRTNKKDARFENTQWKVWSCFQESIFNKNVPFVYRIPNENLISNEMTTCPEKCFVGHLFTWWCSSGNLYLMLRWLFRFLILLNYWI